jgi:hypothetical protein
MIQILDSNGVLGRSLNVNRLESPKEMVPINMGTMNVNSFLRGRERDSIITTFNTHRIKETLTQFCLMHFLSVNHITSPVLYCCQLLTFKVLKRAFISIVTQLIGLVPVQSSKGYLSSLSKTQAHLHITSRVTGTCYLHEFSKEWVKVTAIKSIKHMTVNEREVLEERLTKRFSRESLCRVYSICHCDLFKDNSMFKKSLHLSIGKLSGCLDLYFSGLEELVVDVAITLRAWCGLDVSLSLVFLHHYQTVRPFHIEERRNLYRAIELASFRFWISRLSRFMKLKTSHNINQYDPDEFKWSNVKELSNNGFYFR